MFSSSFFDFNEIPSLLQNSFATGRSNLTLQGIERKHRQPENQNQNKIRAMTR